MPQHLRRTLDALLTGTWFIPSIIASAAFLLALAAFKLDGMAADAAGQDAQGWLRFIYASPSEEARSLMSGLLSSMMTMASLVFSITMVVLTLASRQFGPRLVREFMSSIMTQVVLGTYVMTILYGLLILASTGSRPDAGVVAHPSVTIAIALTFVNAVLLIFFLHSLGRSLMSESIIAKIGRELDTTLGHLQPLDPLDPHDPRDASDPQEQREAVLATLRGPAARFGTAHSGYVEAIETAAAVRAAAAAGVTVALDFRPGDYVEAGGSHIAVYPAQRCDDRLQAAIRRCVVLGIHRTPLQDPMFSIRHLVEIALRALSPGVNDPYTAAAVLDRLSASLATLMGLALPSGVSRDAAGDVRLVVQEPTHSTLVDAALDQIRQNARDKPLVLIHMIAAIARIAAHVRLPVHLELLDEKLDTLQKEIALGLQHPHDLASVCGRLAQVRERLAAQREALAVEDRRPTARHDTGIARSARASGGAVHGRA
jgi:uncharacterized membrane protein